MFQLPGANALDVADQVRVVMEKLKPSFPQGMIYEIPFDTTKFVRQAIREVYKTLVEAGAARAGRHPALPAGLARGAGARHDRARDDHRRASPGMALFGFTVNLLTLFGLVLAIGIVVDDAIVIVENAAHHIDAERLGPREATIKAMDEVTGPVIGITLVLMAVFLPSAFLGGITGQLYRQFALTIAITAVISAMNALTLKPAQCAVWLRHSPEHRNAFFRAFNARLRAGGARLRRSRGLDGAETDGDDARLRRADRGDPVGLRIAADGLPADRGPGLRDQRHPAARRGITVAHRARDREDEPDRRVHAGRRRLELVGRPLDPRRHGRRECRHVLRRLQALGGAR